MHSIIFITGLINYFSVCPNIWPLSLSVVHLCRVSLLHHSDSTKLMYMILAYLTNPHKGRDHKPVGERLPHRICRELPTSLFSLRPTLTGLSTVKEGLRVTPFRRCGNATVGTPPKRTGQSEIIQTAYSSLRRWCTLQVWR